MHNPPLFLALPSKRRGPRWEAGLWTKSSGGLAACAAFGIAGLAGADVGIVAQTASLLYRGLPACGTLSGDDALELATPCRLAVGDTAGWQPALRPRLPMVPG